MKKNLPLQEDEITAAIEALAGAGQKVTYKTIRDHIGRGSNSQIGPAYRKWMHDNRPAPNDDDVPSELVESARELLAQLWQSASLQQRYLLAEERNHIKEQSRINDVAIERIEAENQHLSELVESEQDRNKQLHNINAELRSELHESAEEIHELTLNLSVLQEKVTIKDGVITSLNEQLTTTNALAIANQNEASNLKVEVTKLTSTNDVIKNIASEAQATSLAQASEISRLSSDLKTSTETALLSQEQCKKLTEKVTNIEDALRSSQRDYHAVEQSNKLKDAQIETLKNDVSELKNELKLAAEKAEVSRLEAAQQADKFRAELQEKLDAERNLRQEVEARLKVMMSLEAMIKNTKEG